MLHTTTIEHHTLVLLRKLQQIPEFKQLRLVGGTALALQIGHRKSIDLDFFGLINLSGQEIVDVLNNYEIKDVMLNNESKNFHVFNIENVKVDIVNYPYEWLGDNLIIDDIIMASKSDIAAMKLEAITNRGTKKDFIDIYFLLKYFTIHQLLDLYIDKFPKGSVYNVVRSLTYFKDAEDQVSPHMIIKVSWDEIKNKIQDEIRKL